MSLRKAVPALAASAVLVGFVCLSSLPLDACLEQLPVASPNRVAVSAWNVYRDQTYPFEIQYPLDWTIAAMPNDVISENAVITFVPMYDPSISADGAKTYLLSLSVTVALAPCPCLPERRIDHGASLLYPANVHMHQPQRTGFLQTVSSEGAVGNRYQTTALVTSFAGTGYEITLFVHSANPGCYPRGAVVPFDPLEIEQLFEAMIDSFCLEVRSDCFWTQ